MKTLSLLALAISIFFLASCVRNQTEDKKQVQAEQAKVIAMSDRERAARTKNSLYKKPSLQAIQVQHHLISQPYQLNERGGSEQYKQMKSNSINLVAQTPVSTFSVDVDMASYSNIRRLLKQGALPRTDAVRLEEMINYFSYDYPQNQQASSAAFNIYTEVGSSPFNTGKHLLHIGIKAKSATADERPPSNLVFLLDVSGSMNSANKLGLLKNSLKMLAKQLNSKDKVAIVVYAGAAGIVLKPTQGDNSQAIIDALNKLSAGGSTNGGEGIQLAYSLASSSFIKGGINRVILATDGDFNLGMVNNIALKDLIKQHRKSGVTLSILGFGIGNYNDQLMQTLAQNGNGNAYYIDSLNEARKVLVEELSATLMIIAKDVKIQVEFNPERVTEYRLIGYETRALNREDFNNDNVDAGDVGAGHSVTALYEISLVGENSAAIDPLRYQTKNNTESLANNTGELAFVKLRYKPIEQHVSQFISASVEYSAIERLIEKTSVNYQFSAAVAGFGQWLLGGENLTNMNIENIISLAQQGKGDDMHGYRAEFINMVKLAQALSPKLAGTQGDTITLTEKN